MSDTLHVKYTVHTLSEACGVYKDDAHKDDFCCSWVTKGGRGWEGAKLSGGLLPSSMGILSLQGPLPQQGSRSPCNYNPAVSIIQGMKRGHICPFIKTTGIHAHAFRETAFLQTKQGMEATAPMPLQSWRMEQMATLQSGHQCTVVACSHMHGIDTLSHVSCRNAFRVAILACQAKHCSLLTPLCALQTTSALRDQASKTTSAASQAVSSDPVSLPLLPCTPDGASACAVQHHLQRR